MKKPVLILLLLTACAGATKTEHRTVTILDNTMLFESGTIGSQRFASVALAGKDGWQGRFKGHKEKWGERRDFLRECVKQEAQRICASPFYATTKSPIYNMLDSDETMGGAAVVLGVTTSMLAYLAAEASTKDTNIPAAVYTEFSCMPGAQ